MAKKLDIAFEEAYKISSATTLKLPPDVMLQLYAYYKQATKGSKYVYPSGNVELRNAFKMNAWIQVSQMSEDDAKKAYIALVDKYLKNQ